MKRGILWGLLVVLVSCGKESRSPQNTKDIDKQIEAHLIYGEDNRLEDYQASEALKALAASTVALVKSSSLVARSDGYQLLGSKYGDSYQLCSSEPFREQTSGAFCSGSLVGPDLIMTAGHCITSQADCRDVRFVFDFALIEPGVEKRNFTQAEVYACQEIVARAERGNGADYAIIRLDRKVVSRDALKVRRSGVVGKGDSLIVIGHPAGIPRKIAGGASVRSVSSEHFVANLDTYGGNSGSAVFNSRTNEIEGILVRGDTDFTWAGSCSVSNRCADGECRGEDVTRIDQVVEFIPTLEDEVEAPSETETQVYSATPQLSIPDSSPAGISSSVEALAAPQGRKVLIYVDISHTYRGDLEVEVSSPSGFKVVLHSRSGGSLDHLQGAYGRDLTSAQSMDSLSREMRAGKWKLKVMDKAALDKGVLKKWAVIF